MDVVTPLPAYPPEIGRWLWALEEARRPTLRITAELSQDALDWRGSDGLENSIGSLLYHLALVEMSWLHFDLLGLPKLPPELAGDYPWPFADAKRCLTHVSGVPLADHLGRLHRSRRIFLDHFRDMSLDDWHQPREFADRSSPEWVVFHLIEHEAGHAFQISALARRFGRL